MVWMSSRASPWSDVTTPIRSRNLGGCSLSLAVGSLLKLVDGRYLIVLVKDVPRNDISLGDAIEQPSALYGFEITPSEIHPFPGR
jgi:hypothetical protein